jgi:hypothetical protein
MRKLLALLLGTVVLSITLPARGALQYNLLPETGEGFFSVDITQTVYIDIRKEDGTQVPIQTSVISKIGWYYYDDVVKFREKTAKPGRKLFAPKPPKVRYGDMKKQLAADICKVTLPIREKIDAVYNDTDYLRKVTQMGRDKARESAIATLTLAKKAVGFKVF